MARGPLRFAVLGAGRIGSVHAELLAHRVEGVELVAVADVDAPRAGRVAARVGAAALPVAAAIEAVEVVAVCAPVSAQVDLVVEAAAAGRHVFCEKPLALELGEADRAIAAAQKAGVLLHVGFNRRFDPSHEAVREAVAAGALGELHLVRITSRDPEPPPPAYTPRSGGILLDTAIHDFDMARFMTGSEVVEVSAWGAARIGPDVDTVVTVLRHADGVLTTVDNSWHAAYGYDQRVEAFGPQGMASSGNPPTHATVVASARGSTSARLHTFFVDRYLEAYTRQWEAFVAAIGTGGPPPVTGGDAREALRVALAAHANLESPAHDLPPSHRESEDPRHDAGASSRS